MSQQSQVEVETVRASADLPDSVIEEAEEAGVDVAAVIESQIDQRSSSGYGPDTIARFTKNALESRIEAQNADAFEGILLGSRDRHGQSFPRQNALIRSDEEHMELSSWDGEVDTSEGNTIQIPHGDLVSANAVHQPEYDSYQLQSINSNRTLYPQELAESLLKVGKDPEDLNPGFEGNLVVLKGTISSINPQTIFEDGEPGPDGPVLIEDAHGNLKPHFEVMMYPEGDDGNTVVQAHIERQRYGSPFFRVPDLKALCRDAMGKNEPGSQATFLENGLSGVPVAIAGYVTRYDTTRDDETGEATHYVDVAINGMVSLTPAGGLDGEREPSAPGARQGAQDSLDSFDGEDDETDQDDGDDSEASSEDDSVDEPASDDDPDEQDSADIDHVVDIIEAFATASGVDPSELTVDDVSGNLPQEYPDPVIQAALDRLAADDSDDEESSDEESSESSDGGDDDSGFDYDEDHPVWDEIFSDGSGMYHCPVDDCLFAEGDSGMVAHHAEEEHGADEPAEFLDDHVGA